MGLPPAQSAAGPSDVARGEQSGSRPSRASTPSNGKKDERQYTAEVPSKPKDAFLRAMSGDVHHGIPNDRLSALVEAVRLDGDAKLTYIQQAATAAHLAQAACELHRVCRHDRSDPRLDNVDKSLEGTTIFWSIGCVITSAERPKEGGLSLLLKRNEVQSLEDEPSHGSQSTGLNSAEDIHPSNSGSLARYHLAEDEEERSQEDSEDESDSDKPIELDGEEERIWQGMIYSRALAPDGTDDSWGGDSLAIDEDESDDEDVKPKDKRKGKRTSAMSIVSRRESAGSGAGGEKDGAKRGKQTKAQEESEEDSPSPVKRKGARESNGADVKKPKRRR
ncbi:hypothetical protein D1P53_004732 [Cryptococcus gattii VGV]|nr:hypothetical protein D1P53_004732 [Cryptococcus gattii VGV]